MNDEKKQILKEKLRAVKGKITEAQGILQHISEDYHNPEEVRDKAIRISSALGIDVDEISRIKKSIKHK